MVGDEFFGDLSNCGWGAFAQYVCADEKAVALKPAGSTFEQAAAIPLAGVTALQGLRDKGQLQAGQEVLIIGASGGVGSFAVQIAKALGAKVTAVCSTPKVEMVRSLGADQVLDYKKQDILQSGGTYDLILDIAATHSMRSFAPLLKPTGRYVVAGGALSRIFQSMLLGPLFSLFGSKKFGNLMAQPNQKDLKFLKELFEKGQLKPAIDKIYPLREVKEGLRYLQDGRAQGKVVISI
jgi:NADPH:quinone reductase-like Zn-dependent oxidoreductase